MPLLSPHPKCRLSFHIRRDGGGRGGRYGHRVSVMCSTAGASSVSTTIKVMQTDFAGTESKFIT